ncbi:magnesium-dependent phosphatase-1 superfamily [Caudoviricetes sp.]|nr:magnesium-dependent phosphatase-1 superfamily [Caudoviricetes sp.]
MTTTPPTIAFDCDETLWNNREQKPNAKVVNLYRAFDAMGFKMIVWSAAGEEWAREVARRCGITPDLCKEKPPLDMYAGYVDLAIDDCEACGRQNLLLPTKSTND